MFLDLPRSDRPPRAENASTVTSTEEGRAFFQQRLAAFGLCLFVLAGGSWGLRPEERPLDARKLRSQLEACELAQPWTAERAIAGWQAHAASAPPSDAPAAESHTIALDVSARAAAQSHAGR